VIRILSAGYGKRHWKSGPRFEKGVNTFGRGIWLPSQLDWHDSVKPEGTRLYGVRRHVSAFPTPVRVSAGVPIASDCVGGAKPGRRKSVVVPTPLLPGSRPRFTPRAQGHSRMSGSTEGRGSGAMPVTVGQRTRSSIVQFGRLRSKSSARAP
jgi:hypothetical protein